MTTMTSEREALEETQEIITSEVRDGVYTSQPGSSWQRAPERSLKYPSIHINFLRRQAD